MKTKTKWLCGLTALILLIGGTTYAVGGRVLVDFLQFSANAAPAVSPSAKSVTYYDTTLNYNLISENGAAYRRASLLGRTDTASPFVTTVGSTGATSTTGTFNVAIGWNALNAIGGTAASSSTGIGFQAGVNDIGGSNVYLGTNTGGTLTTGVGCTILGLSADVSTSGANYAIAIGAGAVSATNTFVAGASGSQFISDVYFAKGITDSSPTAFTIHGTGANSSVNLLGGGVVIAGGAGTGLARGGSVIIQTSPAIGTGSTSQTLRDRYIVVARGQALTDAVATTIATMTLTNGTSGGCTIHATIQVTDATDFQSLNTTVEVAIVNKAGTYTSDIVSSLGAKALSAGTLTATWTVTAAGAIQLSADTSLTPSGTNSFVVYYTITNNSQSSITLP